jgi:hypothetical protein
MTRAGRLQDLIDCGSHRGLTVNYFPEEEIEKASKATDEFVAGKNNDGYFILLRRLESCMISKGYHEIPFGQCEGNEPYQARCMWP